MILGLEEYHSIFVINMEVVFGDIIGYQIDEKKKPGLAGCKEKVS